ncbi:hypothetical protein LNP74_27180 [Klebsiella pneumoniae subsp. pneumoniae]|nr:hypothetical protein [Klebsiella pneumoniae subsp. pneumoniae]
MSTYVDYKINLLDEDDRFYKTAVSRPMISSPLGLVLSVLIPVKARVQRVFYIPAPLRSLFFDIAAFQAYLPSL